MLRIIKSDQGNCKCGSPGKIKTGIGWHCDSCLAYTPTKLVDPAAENLKANLRKLMELHGKLKFQIQELERIVK